MGIACFQYNIFGLTRAKQGLNRQIMAIEEKRNVVSAQISSKLIQATKEAQIENNRTVNWNQDTDVKLLQLQDNNLDMQQKEFESQLKKIEADLEAFEKQKEENVKDGVPHLSI